MTERAGLQSFALSWSKAASSIAEIRLDDVFTLPTSETRTN